MQVHLHATDSESSPEKLGLLYAIKPPTGCVPGLGMPAFEGWNGELLGLGEGLLCDQAQLPRRSRKSGSTSGVTTAQSELL